ncbi:MAG TPA: rhodanese-like domain-containing protein [Pseudomonadales bacterium]|nr:rhodanese-like domain-containing protein [Pseudomonadales bacterium]HND15027.1 rhodanese-like domain-containing protein [Pseudomonadales bacterium]
MELFIEFIGARWYLFALVILLMFLLMNHERRRGGPSISPAQLTMLVNQHEGVVVDLRETADFRQGHIVDSISVPAAKFAERIAELERHRDKPVVLVCKYGQSVNDASKALRQNGFDKVFKLGGGITEWQNQQLPLVRS